MGRKRGNAGGLISSAQKKRGQRRLAATHSVSGSESVAETQPYRESEVPSAPSVRWRRLVGGFLVAAVLVLSAHAIRSAPMPRVGTDVVFSGDRVPRELATHWIRQFPNGRALFENADTDTLNAFRAFLSRRPSVEEVRRVSLRAEDDGRVVGVDLSLREPLLPAQHADRRRVWLSAEGHQLHPSLRGPADQPVLFGVRNGGEANLREVLQAWRMLRDRLPEGYVTGIRCDQPQYDGSVRGIRFYLRSGTVVDWGGAGVERYGLSVEDKIENLIRTIKCQGDMRKVERIDVRFPRPFAVIPSAS